MSWGSSRVVSEGKEASTAARLGEAPLMELALVGK